VPLTAVLDSTIHHEEAGTGAPVVLLHGNPTSSFLWRAVIPPLAVEARCLAPDLIGFGRSGKPPIPYRFEDHARYLDAWFDALGLDRVTIVGHDWGGALGFHWAARHPRRVAGVAFMETIVKPLRWEEWPANAVDIFRLLRTPDTGEELIFDRNIFIEGILPAAVLRRLSEEEMQTYRAPFVARHTRTPMLVWPRELPIDGTPGDVIEAVESYGTWLAESDDVPKLLLTFEPGSIMTPPVIDWCRENVAALEVEHVGPGNHFVQEDQGPAIGTALAAWRRRHRPGA